MIPESYLMHYGTKGMRWGYSNSKYYKAVGTPASSKSQAVQNRLSRIAKTGPLITDTKNKVSKPVINKSYLVTSARTAISSKYPKTVGQATKTNNSYTGNKVLNKSEYLNSETKKYSGVGKRNYDIQTAISDLYGLVNENSLGGHKYVDSEDMKKMQWDLVDAIKEKNIVKGAKAAANILSEVGGALAQIPISYMYDSSDREWLAGRVKEIINGYKNDVDPTKSKGYERYMSSWNR